MLQELAQSYFKPEELEGKQVSLYSGHSFFGDASLTSLQVEYLEKASQELGLNHKTIVLRPGVNIVGPGIRIHSLGESALFLVLGDSHMDFERMLNRAENLLLNDSIGGREILR